MNPKFFDIHSHLNFSDYEVDFDEVIKRLRETNTHTITVGTDFESSKKAVELADKYKEIYACIGIHPVDKLESFEVNKFESLVQHPKVVAIGECGMDFFHVDKNEDYKRQEKLFLDQIHFAVEHDKPIMIHARNAYLEILEILEPLKKEFGDRIRGNVHFFAGSVEIAKRFLNIGFIISFTGVITFPPKADHPLADTYEVIKNTPLNMIMSETDSPYVAPVPYRGKRNEPSYVQEVVKKIAQIRNEDFEKVRNVLVNNAVKMFLLK